MSTNDRLEILEMLAQGKITAQEAVALLDGVKTPETAAYDPATLKSAEVDDLTIEEIKVSETQDLYSPKSVTVGGSVAATPANGHKARWLKIRVDDLSTGRRRVSIALPLSLVSFGLGVARRFGADMSDLGPVEPEAFLALLREGEQGVLVDVEDEEDNERVQIYLE